MSVLDSLERQSILRKAHEREMEVLATTAHGALAALHFLAFIFNARRGNRFDATVHGAFCVYDTVATIKHARAA